MNIGQASKASRVSQRMIRHYEKIGLIPTPPDALDSLFGANEFPVPHYGKIAQKMADLRGFQT